MRNNFHLIKLWWATQFLLPSWILWPYLSNVTVSKLLDMTAWPPHWATVQWCKSWQGVTTLSLCDNLMQGCIVISWTDDTVTLWECLMFRRVRRQEPLYWPAGECLPWLRLTVLSAGRGTFYISSWKDNTALPCLHQQAIKITYCCTCGYCWSKKKLTIIFYT